MERKEVFDQLDLTLTELLKKLPQTDDVFLTEDRNVNYGRLKHYIESKIRVELSRYIEQLKKEVKEIEHLRDNVYNFIPSDSTRAEELAQSCLENSSFIRELYIDKANKQDKQFKKIRQENNNYHKHLQQFELEVYEEIKELREELRQSKIEIKHLKKKLPNSVKNEKMDTKKINFKIRQKPTIKSEHST